MAIRRYRKIASSRNGWVRMYARSCLGQRTTVGDAVHVGLGVQSMPDQPSDGTALFMAYPQNVSFKNGLAISYSKLGWFYRDKMNDAVKAKPYFQQCHDIWKELSEQYPAWQEFRNNYEWAKEQLGY